MSKTYFNVAPRYSGGSSAQVSEDIARKVVEDEKHFYDIALSGVYGEEKRAQAERDGLDGIVYTMTEHSQHWLVCDLITGRVRVKPFNDVTNRTRRPLGHHGCKPCKRYAALHDCAIEYPKLSVYCANGACVSVSGRWRGACYGNLLPDRPDEPEVRCECACHARKG